MKLLIITILAPLYLFAGLINAIAVTVNDEPITLVDIDTKIKQTGQTKDKVLSILIDEILYKQQIKKYNIVVDEFDIDRYLEKLAQNNKMTLFAFKNAVRQQENFDTFKLKIKNQLIHQKLISAIASNKLTNANDEDMKIYYDNNKEQFKLANKIDVIHYTTKDKKQLEAIRTNPMAQQNGVNVLNTTVILKDASAQTQYILTQTPINSYSAIYAENGTYNLFYVSNKSEITTVAFDKVKDNIYSHIMQKRQEEFLKNYFESLKITAKINILR